MIVCCYQADAEQLPPACGGSGPHWGQHVIIHFLVWGNSYQFTRLAIQCLESEVKHLSNQLPLTWTNLVQGVCDDVDVRDIQSTDLQLSIFLVLRFDFSTTQWSLKSPSVPKTTWGLLTDIAMAASANWSKRTRWNRWLNGKETTSRYTYNGWGIYMSLCINVTTDSKHPLLMEPVASLASFWFVGFRLSGLIRNVCFVLSCYVCRADGYICRFDPRQAPLNHPQR